MQQPLHRSAPSLHPRQVTRRAVAPALIPALAAVAAVYACSMVLAFTVLPAHPSLGLAIAFDLTITAAALFWLLAVRPGHAKPAARGRAPARRTAGARYARGRCGAGGHGRARDPRPSYRARGSCAAPWGPWPAG